MLLRYFALTFAIAISIFLGVIGYRWYSDKERIFLAQCDEKIKELLVSPATYKRVDHEFTSRTLNFTATTDYAIRADLQSSALDEVEINLAVRLWQKNFSPPLLRQIKVQFDANNSFNTPLRKIGLCSGLEYDFRDGEMRIGAKLIGN